MATTPPAAASAAPFAAIVNPAIDHAVTTTELDDFGVRAFEHLAHRSPSDIQRLKDLCAQVQELWTATACPMKQQTFQDTGSLLTLPPRLANEVLRVRLGITPRLRKKAKRYRDAQWDKAQMINKRMQEKGQEYAKQVEMLFNAVSKKGDADILPQTIKDVGFLMQTTAANVELLFKKLDVVMEYKKLAEEEVKNAEREKQGDLRSRCRSYRI